MQEITVQKIEHADLASIEQLLNDWVTVGDTGDIDQDRIKRVLTLVQTESQRQGDRVYLTAKNNERKIVGIIGYKKPCDYMQSFCNTHKSAEVINFYTSDHFADYSIADAILARTEELVRAEDGQEIVINRAPRYATEVEAYFKTKPDYKYVGVAKDFFGWNLDTPVWVKRLA
jgi:hypothetical protein